MLKYTVKQIVQAIMCCQQTTVLLNINTTFIKKSSILAPLLTPYIRQNLIEPQKNLHCFHISLNLKRSMLNVSFKDEYLHISDPYNYYQKNICCMYIASVSQEYIYPVNFLHNHKIKCILQLGWSIMDILFSLWQS